MLFVLRDTDRLHLCVSCSATLITRQEADSKRDGQITQADGQGVEWQREESLHSELLDCGKAQKANRRMDEIQTKQLERIWQIFNKQTSQCRCHRSWFHSFPLNLGAPPAPRGAIIFPCLRFNSGIRIFSPLCQFSRDSACSHFLNVFSQLVPVIAPNCLSEGQPQTLYTYYVCGHYPSSCF
jgi:hypothetical protein